MSDVSYTAWDSYWSCLNSTRQRMLARAEAVKHPRVREQALYTLQTMIAGSIQQYVMPRQDYPAFYTLWGPFEALWGGPAADFLYHWCFVDGRRTYRIYGKAGTTCFTDLQVFTGMVWDIAPGEALIIEADAPRASYWSLQLMDLWWGTLDFSYHQSGLNSHQIQVNPDGRFQIVLSFDDPGVPNWLDPIRTPIGQCMLRWYDGGPAQLPETKKIKLAELRLHLPPGTPEISPAQRAESLTQRARDSLRRWHY